MFNDTKTRPDPFLGSHMSDEQILRYGLLDGFDTFIKLIREKRNFLLELTDKYMNPELDISEQERESWKVYRQALRDIPEEVTIQGVNKFNWPTPPIGENLWFSQ